MSRLQDCLARAGEQLDVDVIIPFGLLLPAGRRLIAEALLPQLGASKGMIVFRSYDEVGNVAADIIRLGYAHSVLDEPSPHETHDVEDYVEMFRDWGWAAQGPKPRWME